jgi:hypothetical protein
MRRFPVASRPVVSMVSTPSGRRLSAVSEKYHEHGAIVNST